MNIWARGLSDIGKRRAGNEDSFGVCEAAHLYSVADGMGGHAGGSVASSMAVEIIARLIQEIPAGNNGDELSAAHFETHLSKSIRKACHDIYVRGHKEPKLYGMGTTVSTLWITPGQIHVGHVGDSRAYLLRDGVLHQLTEDHSLVNEQLKLGLLTPDEARVSHLKHVITRSVGFESDVIVDCQSFPYRDKDIYLLCSDGLSNLIPNEDIRNILMQRTLEEIPQFLVDLANRRGGDDNITNVVVQVSMT